MDQRMIRAFQRPEAVLMKTQLMNDGTIQVRDPAYAFGRTPPDTGLGQGNTQAMMNVGGQIEQTMITLDVNPGYMVGS